MSRWGLLGNTTLKFPSGKVNSFHSAWANVVARNNVASASVLGALIANSLGPDSNHTLEKAHPAPVGCGQHTIVTRPRKHCTGDCPNYGKVDRPSAQPGPASGTLGSAGSFPLTMPEVGRSCSHLIPALSSVGSAAGQCICAPLQQRSGS